MKTLLFASLLFAFTAHAETLCYPPVNGDPHYQSELSTYNACVVEQNKQNCSVRSTASTTYEFDSATNLCNSSCATGYYEDVKGNCDPQSTVKPRPAAVVATTTEVVHVPVIVPPKVITIIKTVPVPVKVAPVIEEKKVVPEVVIPQEKPSLLRRILNFLVSLF